MNVGKDTGHLRNILTKDVEIPIKQWIESLLTVLTLYISLISSEFVLSLNGFQFMSYFIVIAIGGFFGLLFSFILADKIRKKYRLIIILIAINFVIFNCFYFDIGLNSSTIFEFLLFMHGFIIILVLVLIYSILNQTTGIMERGRIYTTLATPCILLLPLFVLNAGSLEFNYFYNLFNIFYIIYMVKIRAYKYKFFTPNITIKNSINKDIIKYMIILTLFGFAEGLLSPRDFMITSVSFVTTIGPIILSIGVIGLGFVFDFYGRKTVLLLKIFLFSFVGFLYFFEGIPEIDIFILRYFLSMVMVSIITLFVILSDISPPTAKLFPITALFLILGALAGIYLKEIFITLVGQMLLPVYLACFIFILIAIILLNTREFFLKSERNFDVNLISLYVIYESGILLFYKDFEKPVDNDNISDLRPSLISSGIVGISYFVSEVLKGKKFLSGIENYSSKILIEKGKSVIVALVVHQDLRILREKLKLFLQDFENRFKNYLSTLVGVDITRFNTADELVSLYFIKKPHKKDSA